MPWVVKISQAEEKTYEHLGECLVSHVARSAYRVICWEFSCDAVNIIIKIWGNTMSLPLQQPWPFPCNVATVVTLSSWHNRTDSLHKSRYFNVKCDVTRKHLGHTGNYLQQLFSVCCHHGENGRKWLAGPQAVPIHRENSCGIRGTTSENHFRFAAATVDPTPRTCGWNLA